ncbi:type II secretion system F family protein [Paenibacillus planticolens]|nr:type II secretion system F family protein [Paenibacillus planticolens]
MLILELAAILILLLWGRKRHADFMNEYPYPFRMKVLLPCSYLLVDQLGLMEKLPDFTSKIHHSLLKIYGRGLSAYGCKYFYAELISMSTLSLVIVTLLSILASGDGSVLAFGLLVTVIIPLLMVRDLDVKIRKKQLLMIMELPEVLSTIVLLVNAGETVNRAWIRCVEARPHKAQSPLYKELSQAVHELEMNVSFSRVMEDFSKRCALHEVSLFTSAILLNYKRGGNDFVTALHSLSLDLWQRRKTVARTLGEEASSKLVFPMVLIFVVVMVIVAAPAMLMMK